MKCLNMKVADVLFFIASLITVYSADVSPDVASSQSRTLVDKEFLRKKLEQNCPELLKNIEDNNLTEYTIDCRTLNMNVEPELKQESVLKQACVIVRIMLEYLCDNKPNVTSELFKVPVEVCPFNFSHLQKLNFKFNLLGNNKLVKELTNKDCSRVCSDLQSYQTQCVVLSQLNYHLKVSTQNIVPSEIDKHTLEHTKLTIQKTEYNGASKKIEKEPQTAKSKTIEMSKKKNETTPVKADEPRKNFTKPIREQKTEKITETPKEEQMPKTERKMPVNDNLLGDDEFKPAMEDQNEDLTNEDGIGLVGDSLPERPDFNKVEKVTPPKGKDIYPAEGFFQTEDSHFFFYFIMVSSIIVVVYLAFHNKNKILAYALEGTSGRRSRRRPNSARYRKLETNLEEAISSSATNSAVSSVVY